MKPDETMKNELERGKREVSGKEEAAPRMIQRRYERKAK
jgi:hypothetical protein